MKQSQRMTNTQNEWPPKQPKKRFALWTLPVIILCVCSLAAAWVFADYQMTVYDQFNTMRAAVSEDILYGPVYIDDIYVGGLTLEQARDTLSIQRSEKEKSFDVTLTAGSERWQITADDVPMSWDTETLLNKAYMIGRTGTLEARYSMVTKLTTPIYLESQYTYDKSAVRALTDQIAASLTTQARNAAVVVFDVVNRSFGFSDEQAGQTVDADNLYRSVISALESGQQGVTVPVDVQGIAPTITHAQLEKEYGLIASFTTTTTSNSNRNNNIDLAAQALNGVMIAPGATISFNETTGQRTREKGYLEAGAIENGRTVQEVGGGVCQVSTTLFNALVRADFQIVTRKPHTWPSDYVPRGEDAAVDWPNLDLVMRNTGDTPAFITAWYSDRKITVEVYGLSLGEGVSIDLESVTTYTKKPTETVYTYNANLPAGTTQLLRQARTGYAVQTYKIWYKDGAEISREALYTSDYRMINEEYEYNDGKGGQK